MQTILLLIAIVTALFLVKVDRIIYEALQMDFDFYRPLNDVPPSTDQAIKR
ncbi:hypothetical protein [Tunicatimonas pelagia]|uniref:hypothetical protein n=1 Tax=Tunicatimonas pelagia TaxID=931531 RepID=UPI002665D27F|nr:hypothetical protein [Tunicatimonas pelagia]WKN45070.1 hypothetical protein P0M28_08840 [Tunicatimonas pelagia]